MESKHAIVVSADGFKTEYVKVDFEFDGEGRAIEIIDTYVLKEGESLVYDDLSTALSMYNPQWDGEKWIEESPEPPHGEDETATWDSEAKAWIIGPKPKPPLPAIDVAMLAIAEIYEKLEGLS